MFIVMVNVPFNLSTNLQWPRLARQKDEYSS
jgi:hypothetical protein